MTDWLKHLEFGYNALKEGKSGVAGTHFMAAWEANSENAVTCYAYGHHLLESGNYSEAEPILKKAWDLDTGAVDAGCELLRVRSVLGQMTATLLSELKEKHPDEPSVYLTEIELFVRAGDESKARNALENARKKGAPKDLCDAGEAKILQVEGLKRADAGEYKKAELLFMSAYQKDPGWAGPLINLGTVLVLQNQLEKARECYLESIELEPENQVALYNIAMIKFKLSESDASVYLRKLIEINPEYPGAHQLANEMNEVS